MSKASVAVNPIVLPKNNPGVFQLLLSLLNKPVLFLSSVNSLLLKLAVPQSVVDHHDVSQTELQVSHEVFPIPRKYDKIFS